jgi:hypothetical protein
MSFVNERLAIENHFEEYWQDTPVAWENIAFKAPNNSAWVRLNVLNGSSSYRAINGLKRHLGLVIVQIFVPVNSGTSFARKYADTVVQIFDNKSFNDVVCNVPTVETIGTGGIWHQLNVTIPYWRDEQ